nr:hypothetical protein [Tanacetum cinerariifolium]
AAKLKLKLLMKSAATAASSEEITKQLLLLDAISAAKLPILNPNEFDLWKIRIEQYFLMTDYSLLEVILNGDSPVPTRIIEGVSQPVAPTTAEQRLARKNELKARGRVIFAREYRSPKDQRRPEEEPANFAFMAFSSNSLSSSSDNEVSSCSKACSKAYSQLQSQYDKLTDDFCKFQFDVISYQTGLESVEARLLVYKQNESVFEENIKMLNIESVPSFTQSSEHVKPPRCSVQPSKTTFQAATSVLASPKSNSSGKRRNRKTCFVCKSVDHLIKDCDFHAKKMAKIAQRHYANKGYYKQYAPTPLQHNIPTAVLTQSKPISNTDVGPVSVVFPYIPLTCPIHATQVVTKS